MVLLALYFFGGPVIHGFAYCLFIGVITGTYSSVYIASPIIVDWIAWTQKRPASGAPARPPQGQRPEPRKAPNKANGGQRT